MRGGRKMKRYRKTVIDCDPGIDDSFALLLAMKHLDLLGITAVGGNTGLDNTSRNARFLTELAGRTDIPVYAGYDAPLLERSERAEHVHGIRGLGTVEISEPKKKLESEHATDFLIRTFMEERADVNLTALGPLTNVAQAILKKPALKKRIPEIVLMGGSVTGGNANACAEFNIYADPEAAKIVFQSGIPIKMAGLNLCRQNSMTPKDVETIRRIPNSVAQFASEILDFSVRGSSRAELCDACAVAWLIDPDIVPCSLPMHVDIETKGEFTRGMTVCDYRGYMGTDPKEDIGRKRNYALSHKSENVTAAMEFDRERFLKLLFGTFKSYADG